MFHSYTLLLDNTLAFEHALNIIGKRLLKLNLIKNNRKNVYLPLILIPRQISFLVMLYIRLLGWY